MLAIEKLLSNTEITKIKEDELVTLNALTGIVSQIEGILQRKKHVILYGPPGIGETYWVERACLELAYKDEKVILELEEQELRDMFRV